jgi:hypothetical protein
MCRNMANRPVPGNLAELATSGQLSLGELVSRVTLCRVSTRRQYRGRGRASRGKSVDNRSIKPCERQPDRCRPQDHCGY